MNFTERYQRSSKSPADLYKENYHFLSLEMYLELYNFLYDHQAFPEGTKKLSDSLDIAGYRPSQNDIFTAYKSILFGLVVSNLYPGPGDSPLYLSDTCEVYDIYKQRNLAPPPKEEQEEIIKEIRRIADGYANALSSNIMLKGMEQGRK